MRCLLADSSQEASQEGTDSQDHVSTPQDAAARTPATPASSVSGTSTVSDTQDTPASQEAARTPATPASSVSGTSTVSDTQDPPTSQEAAKTPATPASAVSDSQDTSTKDSTDDTGTPETPETQHNDGYINHTDYAAAEIERNKKDRLSLRTRAPRLWRQGCTMYDSFCAYSGKFLLCVILLSNGYYSHAAVFNLLIPSHTGLDNGTRLAAPGILWKIFDQDVEVVFTGSLGWKNKAGRRGNRRSHHIQLPGPHYVFVRAAEHMGQKLHWSQLRKVLAQVFFNSALPEKKIHKAAVR